jgi:hypothetical protein
MSAAYQENVPPQPVASSREMFERMTDHLGSRASFAMRHEEVETYLQTDGRELLRRMFQEHLEQRAEAERRVEVEGADGIERKGARSGSRRLRTLLGTVEVPRLIYQAPGAASLSPMDASLNLPSDSFSFGVRQRLAQEAATDPFEEVVKRLARTTGAEVAKRQAEELAERGAQDFEAFYARRRAERSASGPSLSAMLSGATAANDVLEKAESSELLVLSFDAKGIVMLPRDLRPATRAAAQRSARRGRKGRPMKRLTRGEKRNRKRMAQVAAVYSLERFPRTAQDIVGELRPVQDVAERRKRPKPTEKRVWASVTDDLSAVIDEAFEEALARDPNKQRQWVVLLDGNEDQLAQVQWAAKKRGVEITIVLDIIHVLEYLWKAAYCFHTQGTQVAEEWVQHRLRLLLEQHDASAVAAGMTRSATLQRLERRAPVDRCAAYLRKHREFLHYGEALAQGLPIATGVIEGACRYVVKDRMDRTGARWSLKGAEAVLRLRALHASGDFDAYWAFHLSQEHLRNHVSQYANGIVPVPLPAPLRRVK